MTMPRVSIVIPTFNRLELTQQCLEALRRETAGNLHEVIVVDNGSSDGTPAFLRAEEAAGRLRAVCNPENLGFGRACNAGAGLSHRELLLFLNNDTIVQSGWLEALVDCVDRDPAVGAVGSRLVYPDGTIQHAGIVFDALGRPGHVHRGLAMDDPRVLVTADFPAVTGACLLVRRELFSRLGGFSDAYRMYVEDIDLCLAIWTAGYRVRYCPRSVVVHLENASVESVAWRDERVLEGLAILRRRWRGRLPAPLAAVCGSAFGQTRPRLALDGARSLVGVVFAEELLKTPELLAAYARVIGADDDATLVIVSPGSVERIGALVEELGLDGEDSPDMLAVGPSATEEELASVADYLLSSNPRPGALAMLPRYDETTIEGLRRLLAAYPVASPRAA